MKRARHNARSGFTIVEMLISIALFSILVTIGVGGFTNALKTQRQVASLISTQSNVSIVLEQMARETRTGDLFCHAIDVTDPDPACGCAPPSPTFPNGTGFQNLGSPVAQQHAALGGNVPVWTCGALSYTNAAGNSIIYSLVNGAIERSVNGASSPITGDNVSVKYLTFTLFGNTEGDNWPPRIVMSIGVTPSSTDPALTGTPLGLQTTISARSIDCTSGATPQC